MPLIYDDELTFKCPHCKRSYAGVRKRGKLFLCSYCESAVSQEIIEKGGNKLCPETQNFYNSNVPYCPHCGQKH